MNPKEVIKYLKRINVALICVTLFAFPILFLTNTTDPYILPKQIFLVIISSVMLLIWSAVNIYQKKLILKTNPFNVPLGIFTLIVLLSSIFSRNAYDSIALSIPILSLLVLFFVMINTITEKKEFIAVISALLLGAAGSTVISILNYFQFYFLPIPAAQSRYFSTFGSPVQHLIYIIPLFILTLFALLGELRSRRIKKNYEGLFYIVTGIIFLIGAALILFQIATVAQKPVLLPYTYGFQIGTAAVSQDSGTYRVLSLFDVPRLLVSLPFGSGYGTFFTDYTRFKLPEINSNNAIWNFPFTYSSSFILELLATTGILGLLSYLFVIARVLRTRSRAGGPIFLGLLTILALSFFLPFSLVNVFLILALIGIYGSFLSVTNDRRVDTISVSLFTSKEFFSVQEVSENFRPGRNDNPALAIIITILVLLVFGTISILSILLLSADSKIFASLSPSNQTNGQKVYDLQRKAIQQFPFRSDYYRIFSQVNQGLANSIAQSVPQGSSPSAQVQQTVSQLLQQSVGNARTAVALAPISSVNWQNLGQIYRTLIGSGQNADQFAIASINQAVLLDPANPLLRIELGGIFYQLQNYDAAQNQFQIAINFKPDFANAYYNLGHALEQKGDLQNALSAYQAALSLVGNDKQSREQLEKEIDSLSKKVGTTPKQGQGSVPSGSAQNQPPLELNAATPVPTRAGGQVDVPPPPGTTATPTPTP